MHNWLPVMHRQAKMGAQPVCPACTHSDETFYHLFRCTHKQMVKTQTMALTQLMDGGIKLGVPRRIMMCIRDLMISYIEGRPMKMHDTSRTLTDAILSQTDIGTQFIFQGYLSIRWFQAISAATDRAETKMARLISLIWHTFTDGIWRTRNEIKHKQDNKNSAEEERRIEETLRSFCETYRRDLRRTDYHLMRYTEEDISKLTLRTKREWMRQLIIARDIYKAELATETKQQTLITQFFKPGK